jgi:hypothetical protein
VQIIGKEWRESEEMRTKYTKRARKYRDERVEALTKFYDAHPDLVVPRSIQPFTKKFRTLTFIYLLFIILYFIYVCLGAVAEERLAKSVEREEIKLEKRRIRANELQYQLNELVKTYARPPPPPGVTPFTLYVNDKKDKLVAVVVLFTNSIIFAQI